MTNVHGSASGLAAHEVALLLAEHDKHENSDDDGRGEHAGNDVNGEWLGHFRRCSAELWRSEVKLCGLKRIRNRESESSYSSKRAGLAGDAEDHRSSDSRPSVCINNQVDTYLPFNTRHVVETRREGLGEESFAKATCEDPLKYWPLDNEIS